jgi:hypothetical protein
MTLEPDIELRRRRYLEFSTPRTIFPFRLSSFAQAFLVPFNSLFPWVSLFSVLTSRYSFSLSCYALATCKSDE